MHFLIAKSKRGTQILKTGSNQKESYKIKYFTVLEECKCNHSHTLERFLSLQLSVESRQAKQEADSDLIRR